MFFGGFPEKYIMYSANLLSGALLKLLNGVLKNTGRCYAKILKNDLTKVLWGVVKLRSSAKILKGVFENMLRDFLQNY